MSKPRDQSGRRSGLRSGRSVAVTLLLLALLLVVAVQGREFWYWFSTMPEPELVSIDSPVIELSLEPPGEVRVLRFGPYRGRRHGPFRVESRGRVMVGSYERGKPTGIWRVTEGGTVIGEGVAAQFAKEGTLPPSVRLLGVEIELDFTPRDGWRWRCHPHLEWQPCIGTFVAVGRSPEGGLVLGDAWIEWLSSDGSLAWPGHRLELEADRTPTRFVSRSVTGYTSLVTSFDAAGEISGQVFVPYEGDASLAITAPPWRDRVTGLPGEQ